MKTNIKITKMQGLGNDFVICEEEEYSKTGISRADFARVICDRHFGIGADGLIIPKYENSKDYDVAWDFYNSDGSIAQMCGNGIRCFAKYVKDKGQAASVMRVKTLAGIIKPEILDSGLVRVNMGVPIVKCKDIPCEFDSHINQKISVKDRVFTLTAVSMGNPHCVIFTDGDLESLALEYGSKIENDVKFPEKTNVEFVSIKNRQEVDMRVWERGCGMTLACGTGACAVAVAGILNGLVDNSIRVNLSGGVLNISWSGDLGESVFMSGPAEYVFFGEYML